MSAAVYQEPYQLPAGILALAVHGAFFVLLYFGFTWQTLPPATMSVELWQSLPDTIAAPPVQPKIEKVESPKIEEVAPPQPEIKPDIVLPDKKKVKTKPVELKPVERKPVEKKTR
jgi:outer membrane biosynthesis protein TonB